MYVTYNSSQLEIVSNFLIITNLHYTECRLNKIRNLRRKSKSRGNKNIHEESFQTIRIGMRWLAHRVTSNIRQNYDFESSFLHSKPRHETLVRHEWTQQQENCRLLISYVKKIKSCLVVLVVNRGRKTISFRKLKTWTRERKRKNSQDRTGHTLTHT